MRWTIGLLLISLSLAGCADSDVSAAEVAEGQLRAYYEGDFDGMVGPIGDVFWDFGSCSAVQRDILLENAREKFDSDREALKNFDSHRELVKFDEMTVAAANIDQFAVKCDEAGIREGDVSLFIPPTEGSPMFDGWYGVYRPIEGGWQMVGGD